MEKNKQCRGCKELLPLCQFYHYKRRGKDWEETLCKNCKNKQNKSYYIKGRYGKKYSNKIVERRRKKRKEIKDKYGLGAGTVWRWGFETSLKVYDKCNRKCVQCGEINGLTIHHLDGKGSNFVKKGLEPNNDINNLIVLCRRCHGRIHGKVGGKMHGKKVSISAKG